MPEVSRILLLDKSGGRFSWSENWAHQKRSIYLSFTTGCSILASLLAVSRALFNQLSITIAGVFADGPGAYLFHGVVEQPYVFHVIDYALCLSESKQKSCVKHVDRGGPQLKSMARPSSLSTPSLYVLIIAALRLLIWHISL